MVYTFMYEYVDKYHYLVFVLIGTVAYNNVHTLLMTPEPSIK